MHTVIITQNEKVYRIWMRTFHPSLHTVFQCTEYYTVHLITFHAVVFAQAELHNIHTNPSVTDNGFVNM